ncbi:glycosyltransferase family protein [Thalassoglobus neptunius]|nr:hypothetical protein [Thalassoglobus neptunius]
MAEVKRKKVLAVASRGGHWTQLLRLRDAFSDCDVVFISTVPEYASMVEGERFRVVPEGNRDSKWKMLRSLLALVQVVVSERPDVVITTGAAPGFFALRIGKLIGAKTMWIDSIANAEELSYSGQLALKQADVVLTQWEHLSSSEGAQYWGSVI